MLFKDFIVRFQTMLGRRHNVRAHFWQSMANYAQTGGGMVLGIVLARMLEPEVFGELVGITAVLAMMMIPFSFSAAQVLVSDGGRTPGLFERVMGMVWVISGLKLLVLTGYVAVAVFNGNERAAWVGFLVGMPLALADWAGVIRSDLEGRGMFKPNFFVQIMGLCIHALVSISLVYLGFGIYGLALGGFAAFLPNLIVYCWFSDRRLTRAAIGREMIREQFVMGFWLWLAAVTEAWFSRIDKVILGRAAGDVPLGYYNRAFNYGPLSHLALSSLMTNATVRALANAPSPREMWRLFSKTSAIVFAGAAANAALWWWFSDPLVVWIFGPQWAGAVPVFRVFAFLSLAYAAGCLPATILIANRDFRALFIFRATGLSVLVVGLGVLYASRALGPENAAACFCLSYAVMGMFLFTRAAVLMRRKCIEYISINS